MASACLWRSLLRRTFLLVVISTSFVYFKVVAFTTFEMRFHDQNGKYTCSENYYEELKKFEAPSIGAVQYLPQNNTLFVGARNSFYEMDLRRPFAAESSYTRQLWDVSSGGVNECLLKGEETWECQNFIQVIEYNPRKKELIVCGTSAQDPMCKNYVNFPSYDNPDEMSGRFKCPFDPSQKSTALFANGSFYTGTIADYSGRDAVIYRSMGPPDLEDLKSLEHDDQWLKAPTFIESFEIDEWVLFFFREVAMEHFNAGDIISRVGKVCMNDKGGDFVLEETWTTYQKARLNCSFPGAYPFYFNYLQDVWMVGEGDDRIFYGVFSTGEHEIPGSAVCMFHLGKIRDIFNEGQFKEKANGMWYPLPKDMEPNPRPGICSLDSKTQEFDSLNFISEHPLMDESVPTHGDQYPVFDLTRADYRLSQVAVHQQNASDGVTYSVMFLGTENGIVLKVVLVPEDGRLRSNLLESIYVTPRDCQENVKELKIVKMGEAPTERHMLLVVTNGSVIELPLQRCANYSQDCSCKQDPYCVWNRLAMECIEYDGSNTFDEVDVGNIQDCEEEDIPEPVPPTCAECLCENVPSKSSTDPLESTVWGTSSRPQPTLASGTANLIQNTTTLVISTTFGPGLVDGNEMSTKASSGTGTGSRTEGNNQLPGRGTESYDSNLIGPELEASTGVNSTTEQLLLGLVIAGWASFLFCVPVILFLLWSRRRKAAKQINIKEEIPFPLNGHPPYHHLFPPASLHDSSTDPTLNEEEEDDETTPPDTPPLRTATLDRRRTRPPAESHFRSLSRPPAPPKPPKRTNSALSHGGRRCPPNGAAVRSPRGSLSSTPTKQRQNSTSSESFDKEPPPPYRHLSGSEDERRRSPSGASNSDLQNEMDQAWITHQQQQSRVDAV